MANTTETVFVEFVVDDSQIESAQETLERTGQVDKQAANQFKATNAELARRQKTIDSLNKQLKETQAQNAKTIEALEQRLETFITDFVSGFGEGIIETLKEAGFEFDEFGKLVNKNNEDTKKSTNSLKSELRSMTLQLAQMKRAGQDNTEEYRALAKAAGELKDTIGDAAAEVNNFASDTSNIDGLINSMQGVAGAFSIAQGLEGAFGAESEELNETLLKVNSAMAILQGLQSVGNVLQKESAASTFLQTAAQKIYNVVIGESIGLMAAFRVALAATGVGALVIGLLALVAAMQKVNKETQAANLALEHNKNIIDADTAAIKRNTDEQIARLEAVNAKESEVIRTRGHGLVLQRQAIVEANALLAQQRATVENTSEAYFLYNRQIEDNNDAIKEIDNQIILEKINLDKQLRTEQLQGIADNLQAQLDAAKKNTKEELILAKETARAKAAIDLNEAGDNLPKRIAIQAALNKELRALDLDFAKVQQQDKIAAAEAALLKTQEKSKAINERTSQDEIDAQKKVIQEQARLALLEEGLTQNQRTLIIQRALDDQLQLQKEFNKKSNEEALQDQISRNNTQLQNLNISNEERLRLTEENIIASAQIEIEAAAGEADKIKEIRARMNADIKAARLASIQSTLQYELSLEEANTGALRRANERIVVDQRKSFTQRIAAINQLAALQIAAINKEEDALEESHKQGLISEKDYQLKLAQLKDKELQVYEDTELKKRQLQKETFLKNVQFVADTANQVAGLLQQFGQQQTDREQNRIDEQRKRIDDLKEAGAITEKEALARQKRLDIEETNLKRRQAQRDKSIALFQAIINTAAATIKAFVEGGPILAAIAAALGAAQIALIASKPIPKFGSGKKNNYEGPAEIGETGPELWQHNGDMYLAKKSTVVWVGKHDRVFNPKETVAMLEKNQMRPYIVKDAETGKYNSIVNNTQIDYDKLGTVIAKNIPQVGLNIDEHGIYTWVEKGNSFSKYLDNRRGFK